MEDAENESEQTEMTENELVVSLELNATKMNEEDWSFEKAHAKFVEKKLFFEKMISDGVKFERLPIKTQEIWKHHRKFVKNFGIDYPKCNCTDTDAKNCPAGSNLSVDIVDFNDNNKIITGNKWLIAQKKILENMAQELQNNPDITDCTFSNSRMIKSIRVVDCGSQQALEILKKCVANVGNLWPDCDLRVLKHGSLIIEKTATVKIALTDPINIDDLISRLPALNSKCYIKEWELHSKCDIGEHRIYKYMINTNSKLHKHKPISVTVNGVEYVFKFLREKIPQ